jgi:hypothetical protein
LTGGLPRADPLQTRNVRKRGCVAEFSASQANSIFKRGMKGVYQHCAEKHLHCYLAEFDFSRRR